MSTALSTSGLRKRYGRTIALDGIDLEVAEGELVGLLGPNGAGKSTLTKIACGLVRRSGGEATVLGHECGSAQARARTGYLAELFRFPGWSTADEVLVLHQRLARSDGGAAERARLLELVGLADAAQRRVEAMSKGMQQRLGIAQALVGEPALVLLDEPTSALDPAGRRTVRELLRTLKARGTTVMLSSHLLGEVEQVCDRVVVIDGGRVRAEGSPASLMSSSPPVVEVETATGVQRFPDSRREDVPALVARLVAAGEEIYGVRVVQGNLEDAYLALVGDGAR